MKVTSYYQNKALGYNLGSSRAKSILGLIGTYKGKRVLDVGCATGYLGKILRNQENYVVGIDISKKAVAKAKLVLDEAYACDIESDKLPNLKGKFDLIIMSEVIEHLFDPEETLRQILDKYLKLNGEVLITTPNFLYFVNRAKMLFGKFRYEEKGMLDRSHIRFFSFSSLKELLEKLNLEVGAVNHSAVLSLSSPLVGSFPSLFAYQFIYLLRRNLPKKKWRL